MLSYWKRYLGDASRMEAASPANHADRIKFPVLLMHGSADTTVRIEQSELMERVLRFAGKKVVFIPIEGDTHYMLVAETRIRWLTELEKFLKENIGD